MPKSLNGYSKLMFELKKQQREELPMEKLQALASGKWNGMSQRDRERYSGKKEQDGVTEYNCLGQTVESHVRAAQDKRMKDTKASVVIEEMLQKAVDKKVDGIFNQIFYFFSTSYFGMKREQDIFPAELALAKFSLKDGIIDTMHMMINPGTLPLGYAGEAIKHAMRSHRLDLPPNIQGEKSYKTILETIMNFTEAERFTSEHIPPFFCYTDCEGDDFEAAELTLNKIAVESDNFNAFRIYKADTLLFLLHKKVVENRNNFYKTSDKAFASVIGAWDMLRRDNFTYSSIGCEKHNEDDNSSQCCLSKVQRLGFSFVQYCLDDRFSKTLGKHYPINFCLPSENNTDQNDEDDALWELQNKNSGSFVALSESFRNLTVHSSSHELSQSSLSSITLSSQSSKPDLHIHSRLLRKQFSRICDSLDPQLSDHSIDNTVSSKSSTHELRSITSTRRIRKFNSNLDLSPYENSNDGSSEIKRFEESTAEEEDEKTESSWVDSVPKPHDISKA